MPDNILFSIIIPTYNRAGFIEKTIRSVLEQSYKYFELIIVDDGSTDNTEEIISSIKDKRISYFKKVNEERAAARNYGISKATGDYITFLDSDDILYQNHFQEASELVFKNNPNIFHLGYEVKSESDKILIKVNKRKGDLNKSILKGNSLSCIGVFIKQDILKYIKFNTDRDLSGTEDWLLWLQLAARYRFKYSNSISSTMINHEYRSVNTFNEQSLNYRTTLLIKYLKEDSIFMNKYGKHVNFIQAHMLSYTALHAVLAKKKKIAIKYFAMAVLKNPLELTKKRALGIFKNLLLP